jgi:2-keto-4-pentenoate hydratase/2-oxohepta-3-ene-1,7-dioic acid hydratase in catechol pathway
MKLATYIEHGNDKSKFGVVVDGYVYSFKDLQEEINQHSPELVDIYSYLANLPHSREKAQELAKYAEGSENRVGVSKVKFLPPIPKPAALIDFALTPKHLYNSAMTIIEHEFTGLKKFVAKKLIQKKIDKAKTNKDYPYYKCNHNAVIGDEDTTIWPAYTSYLDIEPELAFVIGNENEPIAGYLILNDFSARDVQMPELEELSLTRSKDFSMGNGIGPFLVTLDEIRSPLNISVEVKVGERFVWKGNTSEYIEDPLKVLEYINTIWRPVPGTIVGMGTIPGCCGLDNNQWILPGEKIEISFDKLGTLNQYIPKNLSKLEKSRWKLREELKKFY